MLSSKLAFEELDIQLNIVQILFISLSPVYGLESIAIMRCHSLRFSKLLNWIPFGPSLLAQNTPVVGQKSARCWSLVSATLFTG
jgi:hypothetical protein